MELDDFKSTFQSLHQQTQTLSASQLNGMLQTKTRSVISKIKRSLIFEIGLSIAFIVGLILFALQTETWALRIYFFIFIPIICFFVLYIYSLYRKVVALQKNADQPVRINLQTIQQLIKNYCKHYMQLTMWMMPICFLLSLALAFASPENSISTLHVPLFNITSAKGALIFLLAYFILIWVGIYYINRWYLDRLYGRYLRQLQNEMDELSID
jgi:Ca2+/Na+ antiporter